MAGTTRLELLTFSACRDVLTDGPPAQLFDQASAGFWLRIGLTHKEQKNCRKS